MSRVSDLLILCTVQFRQQLTGAGSDGPAVCAPGCTSLPLRNAELWRRELTHGTGHYGTTAEECQALIVARYSGPVSAMRLSLPHLAYTRSLASPS